MRVLADLWGKGFLATVYESALEGSGHGHYTDSSASFNYFSQSLFIVKLIHPLLPQAIFENTMASPIMSFSYGLIKRDTAGLRCVNRFGAFARCYGTHARRTFRRSRFPPFFPIFLKFITLYWIDLWYICLPFDSRPPNRTLLTSRAFTRLRHIKTVTVSRPPLIISPVEPELRKK